MLKSKSRENNTKQYMKRMIESILTHMHDIEFRMNIFSIYCSLVNSGMKNDASTKGIEKSKLFQSYFKVT